MNILIISAHPDKNSFNHAIANVTCSRLRHNGYTVFYHDLYEENFDPVMPAEEILKAGKPHELIVNHCIELINSDGVVIIHPNWWGQPPAILKGWIDRVLRPGVAYEFIDGDNGEGIPKYLLKATTGIVFNTSNTNKEREEKVFLDPLETIWKNCIFDLCGIKTFYRKMFRIVITSDEKTRKKWLSEVEDTIDKYFPEL